MSAAAVPIDRQIAEVELELLLRERSYPGLIKEHRMRQEVADRRLTVMRAVLETLLNLKAKGDT